MLAPKSQFRAFGEKRLQEYLDSKKKQLREEIEGESDNYILKVGEGQYIKHLTSKYTVNNLSLNLEEVWVSKEERMIRAERFPRSFNVRKGQKYKTLVFTFHIGFGGDQALLRCRPQTFTQNFPEVVQKDGAITFDVIAFRKEPDYINQEKKRYLNPISSNYRRVRDQVDEFNCALEQHVRGVLKSRKRTLLKQQGLMAQLGVPLHKKDSSETYSIPDPDIPEPIKIKKPQVREAGYEPDPALNNEPYRQILELINAKGKQMERSPIFAEMGEESLRDNILGVLEPRFEGTATGETFNRSGKTDILLRHEGENAFVAECKFWRGRKHFHKMIDQLLGYLTWRDSKTALVVFVDRKDISAIVQKAQDSMERHPCFVERTGINGEAWVEYLLRLPDDPNREIRTALLLFHLPK